MYGPSSVPAQLASLQPSESRANEEAIILSAMSRSSSVVVTSAERVIFVFFDSAISNSLLLNRLG